MSRALLAALVLALSTPAFAQATEWRVEKCARYRAAWSAALEKFGRAGLSEEFVSGHEAFLARGCEDPRDVCPRSAEELALANILIVRAMNAGAASTFAPFACRRDGARMRR